jgi:hypothetical protein
MELRNNSNKKKAAIGNDLFKAKHISMPTLSYSMDFDENTDPKRIDEMILRPHEVDVNNLIIFRRLAAYAHKEVGWNKIAEKILTEV